MELVDKVGPERLIDEVRFSSYHKFASPCGYFPKTPMRIDNSALF